MAPEGQFWVFEGPRPFGDGLKVIWSEKYFFEKIAFFWPPNGPKYTQNGPHGGRWGSQRVNFGVLRLPDPLGVLNGDFGQKIFFEFFRPGRPKNGCPFGLKQARMG